MSLYADVIIPVPVEGTFTYSLPQTMADEVRVGCRLIVPFGKKKYYSAIVFRLHDQKPPYETKEALELLDGQPLVTQAQLKFWQWIADYYLCTLGDVYKAALPSGLKLESESSVMWVDDYEATDDLTPAERCILASLENEPVQTIASLQKNTSVKNILPVVKRMLDKGAVRMKEELKRTYKPRMVMCVRVTEAFFNEQLLNETLDGMKRSPKQADLLLRYADLSRISAALAMQNYQLLKEVTKQELMDSVQSSPAALNALRQKGILEVYQKPVVRIVQNAIPQQLIIHPLSQAQQTAFEQIREQWQQHNVCLLHGVTSSGKTEIYIHLIKEALDQGKQVLYLLPEIVLTAQLTERLRKVFGDRLGVYHSRYPDAERVEVYQKMLSDEPYDILLGVRSSIFLPFRNLGLVIVDEEHETSFKQQDPSPRYHARNAALVLAASAGAKTLLGSATPSMESFYNAERGKYGYVSLTTRFGDVKLPEIEVVDMQDLIRRKLHKGGPFSASLLAHIRQALANRQQVILFQNRRGYAPMMECRVCGWTPRCQRCDVSLTLHRNMRQLTCHYCGTNYSIPPVCPNCSNTDLHGRGYGTERIEDELQRIFPEARIARMDLDTTRSRVSYEQILQDFQYGRTDILVGTQMVTKGLDFEHVSMVGILNASTMLNQPDFRSYERAFQMMEQVAGRAGRRGTQGHVVLQTYDAEAEAIQQVVQHDYRAMFLSQLDERRLFNYPPFCRLVYIYVKHRDERLLEQLSADLAKLMRQVFAERVLGPDTPPIARVQNLYIRKIILKIELSANIGEARRRLREIQQYILSLPQYKSAVMYYDVD